MTVGRISSNVAIAKPLRYELQTSPPEFSLGWQQKDLDKQLVAMNLL